MNNTTLLKKSIVIICLLIPLISFSRQTVLDKKISLQAHNESIATVLTRIEQLAGVNFMYMSGLFDKKKLVTISFTNSSIKVILQKLIPSNEVLLYVVDNKIIFYKKDEAPPGKGGTTYTLSPVETTKKSEPELNAKQAEPVKRIINDTIKITIYDTIKVTTFDTVKIAQKVNQIADSSYLKGLPKMVSSGFIVSCFGGVHFVTERFSGLSNSVSTKVANGENAQKTRSEYGIGIEYYWSHFSIHSGLGISTKKWSASYSYSYIDSILTDEYNIDISWSVIPHKPPGGGFPPIGGSFWDSVKTVTKTPKYDKGTKTISYKGTNAASYISIPLILSYNINLIGRFSATIGTGVMLHLLQNTSGYTIKDNKYTLISTSESLRDYYLSSSSNVGFSYALSKHQVISLKAVALFSITKLMKETYSAQKKEHSFSGILSYGWKF